MALFRIQPDHPWRNPIKHPRPIHVDTRLEHDQIAMELLSTNAWFISQIKHLPDLYLVVRIFNTMIQVDFLPARIEFVLRDRNRPKGAQFSLFKLRHGKLVSVSSELFDERQFPDRLQRVERDLDGCELARATVRALSLSDTAQRSFDI